MKLFRYEAEQTLPMDPPAAWAFFSAPRNLPLITPPWLGFSILGPVPDRAVTGLLIEYTVRPFPLLPLRWVTRLLAVEEPFRFIDEQLAGPYRFWQHEHRFEPVPGGTRMTDRVDYALPLGFMGAMAHPILVRPRLERIFAYRRAALERRFPAGS